MATPTYNNGQYTPWTPAATPASTDPGDSDGGDGSLSTAGDEDSSSSSSYYEPAAYTPPSSTTDDYVAPTTTSQSSSAAAYVAPTSSSTSVYYAPSTSQSTSSSSSTTATTTSSISFASLASTYTISTTPVTPVSVTSSSTVISGTLSRPTIVPVGESNSGSASSHVASFKVAYLIPLFILLPALIVFAVIGYRRRQRSRSIRGDGHSARGVLSPYDEDSEEGGLVEGKFMGGGNGGTMDAWDEKYTKEDNDPRGRGGQSGNGSFKRTWSDLIDRSLGRKKSSANSFSSRMNENERISFYAVPYQDHKQVQEEPFLPPSAANQDDHYTDFDLSRKQSYLTPSEASHERQMRDERGYLWGTKKVDKSLTSKRTNSWGWGSKRYRAKSTGITALGGGAGAFGSRGSRRSERLALNDDESQIPSPSIYSPYTEMGQSLSGRYQRTGTAAGTPAIASLRQKMKEAQNADLDEYLAASRTGDGQELAKEYLNSFSGRRDQWDQFAPGYMNASEVQPNRQFGAPSVVVLPRPPQPLHASPTKAESTVQREGMATQPNRNPIETPTRHLLFSYDSPASTGPRLSNSTRPPLPEPPGTGLKPRNGAEKDPFGSQALFINGSPEKRRVAEAADEGEKRKFEISPGVPMPKFHLETLRMGEKKTVSGGCLIGNGTAKTKKNDEMSHRFSTGEKASAAFRPQSELNQQYQYGTAITTPPGISHPFPSSGRVISGSGGGDKVGRRSRPSFDPEFLESAPLPILEHPSRVKRAVDQIERSSTSAANTPTGNATSATILGTTAVALPGLGRGHTRSQSEPARDIVYGTPSKSTGEVVSSKNSSSRKASSSIRHDSNFQPPQIQKARTIQRPSKAPVLDARRDHENQEDDADDDEQAARIGALLLNRSQSRLDLYPDDTMSMKSMDLGPTRSVSTAAATSSTPTGVIGAITKAEKHIPERQQQRRNLQRQQQEEEQRNNHINFTVRGKASQPHDGGPFQSSAYSEPKPAQRYMRPMAADGSRENNSIDSPLRQPSKVRRQSAGAADRPLSSDPKRLSALLRGGSATDLKGVFQSEDDVEREPEPDTRQNIERWRQEDRGPREEGSRLNNKMEAMLRRSVYNA